MSMSIYTDDYLLSVALLTGAVFVMLFLTLGLIYYIITSLAYYKYFQACGYQDKAWKAWIPFVRDHQILSMSDLSTRWMFILVLVVFIFTIPLVLCIYYIVIALANYQMFENYNGRDKAIPAILLYIVFPIGLVIYMFTVLNRPEFVDDGDFDDYEEIIFEEDDF